MSRGERRKMVKKNDIELKSPTDRDGKDRKYRDTERKNHRAAKTESNRHADRQLRPVTDTH